jgi:ABC-type Fe3+ transport system permease subunit
MGNERERKLERQGRNDDDDDGIPQVALDYAIRTMEFAGFAMLLTIVITFLLRYSIVHSF